MNRPPTTPAGAIAPRKQFSRWNKLWIAIWVAMATLMTIGIVWLALNSEYRECVGKSALEGGGSRSGPDGITRINPDEFPAATYCARENALPEWLVY